MSNILVKNSITNKAVQNLHWLFQQVQDPTSKYGSNETLNTPQRARQSIGSNFYHLDNNRYLIIKLFFEVTATKVSLRK